MEETVLRRSTREVKPPSDYKPAFGGQKYQHLHVQTKDNTVQYDSVRATVAAMAIHKLNLMHTVEVGENYGRQTDGENTFEIYWRFKMPMQRSLFVANLRH